MKNDRDLPDPDSSISHEVAEIRQRLNELEAERKQLRQRLHEIQATCSTSATVTATCPFCKLDRLEILDFSRSWLKHPLHAYVGDFAGSMVAIVLSITA